MTNNYSIWFSITNTISVSSKYNIIVLHNINIIVIHNINIIVIHNIINKCYYKIEQKQWVFKL